MLLDVVGVMTREETHGVGLADLARTTGLPKSSLHRLLLALKQAGYVEKLFVTSPGEIVDKDVPLLSIYSPDLLTTERELVSVFKMREAARSRA